MTYPASVTAAGSLAEAVWDLQTTAGIVNTPNKTPAGNAATLTSEGGSVSGSTITFSASGSHSRWDFTGYDVAVTGAVTVTFTDCQFKNLTSSLHLLYVGADGVATTVNLVNCDVDGTTTGGGINHIRTYLGSALTATGTKFHDASTNYGKIFGDMTLTDCYVGPAGNHYASGDHIEPFQCFNGAQTRLRVMFDARGGSIPTLPAGWSGFDFMDTASFGSLAGYEATAITNTNTNCIFAGVDEVGSAYTNSSAAGPTQHVSRTFTDCILGAGTSGYFTQTDAGGGADLNHTGNRDLTSGLGVLGDTVAPWSGITCSGAMTLSMGSSGTLKVGAGMSGAMTLVMGSAGTLAVYGPVIGSGAMTLTMGMAGDMSSVTGSGAMVLTMSSAGTVTLSDSASASGDMTLVMGTSGTANVGASCSGGMVLTMSMAGTASASGSSAPARGGGTKTAPGRVGKTKTASPRSSTTIIAA